MSQQTRRENVASRCDLLPPNFPRIVVFWVPAASDRGRANFALRGFSEVRMAPVLRDPSAVHSSASKKADLAASDVARSGPRFPQLMHSTMRPPPGARITVKGVWGGQRRVSGRGRSGFLPIRKETSAIFAYAPANGGYPKARRELAGPDRLGYPRSEGGSGQPKTHRQVRQCALHCSRCNRLRSLELSGARVAD